MSDVAERLRRMYQGYGGTMGTVNEAADVIESLRQQLATTERLLAESQAREKALLEGVSGLMDHQYTGTSEAMFYLQNLVDVADELKGGEQG